MIIEEGTIVHIKGHNKEHWHRIITNTPPPCVTLGIDKAPPNTCFIASWFNGKYKYTSCEYISNIERI